jgi:integrase
MWRQHTHHRYWSWLRKLADRPGLDFYELRHCAATMLLSAAPLRGTLPSSSATPTAAS